MRAFSQLLDDLVYTRSRNSKLRLIGDYLKETPDPDRGYGLAALTGTLDIPARQAGGDPRPGRRADRSRPVLHEPRLCRRFRPRPFRCCGPAAPASPELDDATISISSAIERLRSASKLDAPRALADMLDHLDASGRFALLKLATGGLRVGINARLAKQALATAFGLEVEAVEEVWHGLRPPFGELFDWAEGRAEQPAVRDVPVFRPFMLAHPLDETKVSLADYAAEWKWDGIRVQIVHAGDETRLYSRTGDDISAAASPTSPRPSRRTVSRTASCLCAAKRRVRAWKSNRRPASTRFSSGSGARTSAPGCSALIPPSFGFTTSCSMATRICASCPGPTAASGSNGSQRRSIPERFDVSQLIAANSFEALEELRTSARDVAIEGIMLKRRDSTYVAGRRTGLWYKWKRDPLTADCVLMYAQRGSGKRSSYYSDYTFGCWTEEGELLPVGKAYFGFTDEELKWLDRWVRGHTVQRFGPVREVEKGLVLEVAFDSIHTSSRHKSGLAMRFPRVSRIRTDKPAAEADRIATLRAMAT